MKTITCKSLGGACDKEFTVNTFDELVEQLKAHGMEMFMAQEPAHMGLAQQIIELMQDPLKMQQFYEEKRKLFEQLPSN